MRSEHPETPAVEEPRPVPCLPPLPCGTVGGDSSRPERGQIIYRVYGGSSPPLGRSWTPEDPTEVQQSPDLVALWGGYAFRAVAGLPDGNTGERLTMARLRDPGAVEPRQVGRDGDEAPSQR
jgi:hypothetical protein